MRALDDHATLLHAAARLGYERIVELLLQRKAPVNIKDIHLRTPLCWAASGNNANLVRLLLARGASITIKDEDGNTPLLIAAKSQQVESAKALLEHKAKLTVTDNEGMTPLHMASVSGCADLVKLFVQGHGASVNVKDKVGNTALHHAETPEVVDILMQGKAKTEVKNKFHQAPLHIMAMNDHAKAAEMLIRRGAAVDVWDHEKVTPLMRAVFDNKPNMVEVFLRCGASATYKITKEKYTPLHLAAEQGATAVITKILDSASWERVNIDIRDAQNETPLYYATKHKKNDAARLLIDRGAWLDPTTKDVRNAGGTPLLVAASDGNWELVRLLCEKGANVHAKAIKTGITALHCTASQGNLEITKLLISKGTSVHHPDSDGFSALIHAEIRAPTKEVARYRTCKNSMLVPR
ncbi:hypothetical protein JMJ35_004624 [Cladonia borealis]|uniref:Ankyrin n=1 Tax=Cladonia borealis TaxID=184061 RepID=A0AA39V1W7_9LECA|nr:hypothetical protein JMJ35_004624 [Cladonia borealis]